MKVHSSDPEHVLVMGVGRSGTTAVFGLLQHILEDRYPGDVDYVYEPFLWDRKTFNKPYSQLADEFRYVASVSVEGMYHHKQLPMLVGDHSVIDQSSRAWLAETLSPTGGKSHYLGKMIRANGRIRLIRDLAPTTKIIFVMRNPVDVLNSATQLFSFYGNEFHRSDFDRFAVEVESHFHKRIESSSNEVSKIEAEYAYWYYSNLAFLEYANKHPQYIFTIGYEAFIENRLELVRRICEFVEIDFQPEFEEVSKERLGSVQHTIIALNQAEFSFLHNKLDDYKKLLALVDETPPTPIEDLIKIEQGNKYAQAGGNSLPFNALYANNKLRRRNHELQKLRNEQLQVRSQLLQIRSSKRYRFINWLLRPLDKLKSRRRRPAR